MGQLFHLVFDLKQYILGCLSPLPKPSHFPKLKTIIALVVINPHMVVILIHVGKNLVEDVLLDGGSEVNIIIEDLQKKLNLLTPRPTPYTL